MIQTTDRGNTQKPSSVGLAWPPRYDARNQRVKGFGPCLVEDNLEMARMLEDTARAAAGRPATRVALRFFASDELASSLSGSIDESGLDRLAARAGGRMRMEAMFSVGSVIPGHSLVYLGFNASSRMAPESVVAAELESFARVSSMQPTTLEAALAKLDNANLRIERLTHPDRTDLEQITSVYRRAFQKYLFPITTRTIAEVVNNGNMTLVIRDGQNRILSSMVAEHASFWLGGRTLNIIELSEAATNAESRGNGLMTAMFIEAVVRLRTMYDPADTIVYVESRAPWEPVNIATRRAGFEYCGMTPQHCTIVSDRSPGMQYRGDLEDLGVWVHPNF